MAKIVAKDPLEGIDVGLALNSMQQMVNHFRAFKDAEAALNIIGNISQVASELQLKVSGLQKQKDMAETETMEAELARDKAVEQFKREIASAEEDSRLKVAKARSAAEETITEIQKNLLAAKTKQEEDVKKMKDEIAALDENRKAAQEAFSAINKRFEGFRTAMAAMEK